jgi:hypothetical protein
LELHQAFTDCDENAELITQGAECAEGKVQRNKKEWEPSSNSWYARERSGNPSSAGSGLHQQQAVLRIASAGGVDAPS